MAYYNCAISYKSLGKMEDCEKFYRKAVEVNPRYSYAWNNLGNIYKNKEDYE
jgi:tetratricopeptide (TPR) repeat protein